MQEIQHAKTKIYYSMGEVAEMFDVKPSLIRFWEQKFDILKPHKNKKGNRMFTPEDVDNLKVIYHLVKEKGMTLLGAQKRIKDNKEGVRRDMEIVERLLNMKSILMEIRQELKEDAAEVIVDDDFEFVPTEQVVVNQVVVTIDSRSSVPEAAVAQVLQQDSTFELEEEEPVEQNVEEVVAHREQMLFEDMLSEVDAGYGLEPCPQQEAQMWPELETVPEPVPESSLPRVIEQTLF